MFFVLNTGRAGSNTISRVLSQSPNCQCLHEPEPILVEEAAKYRYGDLSGKAIVQLLKATRPSDNKEIHYGESNNKLSLLIPLLEEAFHRCYYIWLIRDGRNVVCSGVQRGWFTEMDFAENAIVWRRWRLQGDRLGLVSTEEWQSWSSFEKNCWFWNYNNRLIQKDLLSISPKRTFFLTIENLANSLLDLCDFLKITPTNFVIQHHNQRTTDINAISSANYAEKIMTWHDWDETQCEIFKKHCGALMDEIYPSWRNGEDWQDIETNLSSDSKLVVGTSGHSSVYAGNKMDENLLLLHSDLSEIKQLRGEVSALTRLYRNLSKNSTYQQKMQEKARDILVQMDENRVNEKECKKRIQQLEHKLQEVLDSKSWKIGQMLVRPIKFVIQLPISVILFFYHFIKLIPNQSKLANFLEGNKGKQFYLSKSLLNESQLLADIKVKRISGRLNDAKNDVNKLLLAQSNFSIPVLLEFAVLADEMGDWQFVRQCCTEILQKKPYNYKALELEHRTCVRFLPLEALRKVVDHDMQQGGYRYLISVSTAIMIAYYEDQDWKKVVSIVEQLTVMGGMRTLVDKLKIGNNLSIVKRLRELMCVFRIHEVLSQAYLGNAEIVDTLYQKLKTDFPQNDEVDLLHAEIARLQDNYSKQLDIINSVLERYNLHPIRNKNNTTGLAIANLSCDVPKTTQDKALISVIMTVYGRDELLQVALDSILNQSHHNLELLIVDDCSLDDTYEWLENQAKHDSRIRLFRCGQNSGTYVAKNIALSHARGEYITFMDSDDWSHPQRLEQQLKILENNHDIVGVCHKYFRVDGDGHINFRRVAIRKAFISLMFRRSVFERIGYFLSIRVGADSEYVARIRTVFGDTSIKQKSSLTILVTHRSTSLTSGGRFAIGWRDIIGVRHENHLAFRAWHRRIAAGFEQPFVGFPMKTLPYPIPAELFLK